MPRTVDIDERRLELATAAARVIARDGINRATVREVAAEAGLTSGALTHYFPDKRGLLRFTLENSLARRRSRGSQRDRLDALAALRSSLVDALPISEESKLHWVVTLAFCAQAAGDSDFMSLQRDAYRVFLTDVTRRVEATGRASGEAARWVAERLIAVLDGVAVQAMFDPDSWEPERQIAHVDAALAEI